MLGMASTQKRKFPEVNSGGTSKRSKVMEDSKSAFESNLASMENVESEMELERRDSADVEMEEDSTSSSQQGQSPTPPVGSRWKRPAAPALDSQKEALTFLHLELDHYVAGSNFPGMPGPAEGPAAVVRMFGVTEAENSVCLHIHGFAPYLYIPAPPGDLEDGEAEEFRMNLNAALLNDMRSNKQQVSTAVLAVDIVSKESIYGYHDNRKMPFLKITVALPKFIAAAKRILEGGTIGTSKHRPQPYSTFESNVDFEVRFMVDANVVGCSWIELPAGKYKLRSVGSHQFPALSRSAHLLN